jgi:hypothetical protein
VTIRISLKGRIVPGNPFANLAHELWHGFEITTEQQSLNKDKREEGAVRLRTSFVVMLRKASFQ